LNKSVSANNFIQPSGYIYLVKQNTIYISGIVSLTGKVIEHTEGYRAEKMEVKKLIWVEDDDKYELSYIDEKEENKKEKEDTKLWLGTSPNINVTNTADITGATLNIISTFSQLLGKPTKKFKKEQIIKSLQDYYKVPVIYYKDYLEKELLK